MDWLRSIPWSGVVAALPTIGVVWQVLLPDRQLENRIKRHAELRDKLPSGAAADRLDQLLADEIADLVSRSERRAKRVVNWGGVFAIIFVLAIATLVVLGLWAWSGIEIHVAWKVVLRTIAVLVGILTFAIAVGGGGPLIWESAEITGAAGPAPN